MRRFFPYFKYVRPVLWPLIAGLICGGLYALANGAGLPYMIKTVFPEIFSDKGQDKSFWEIALIAAWLPGVFIIRGIFGYLNTYLIQYVGTRVLEQVRYDYFRKLQFLPLSFIQRHNSGDLISRGMADTNQLQTTVSGLANELIKQPATLLVSMGYLVWLAFNESGVLLVLVCLASVPICVLPIRYAGKKVLKRAMQLQGEMGVITQVFNENLGAAREVRAFSMEEREAKRFASSSHALLAYQMKIVKYAKALSPTIEIISSFGLAATFLYAYNSNISLEVFLSIVTALYVCYSPIKQLSTLLNDTKRGIASLDRIEEVLNEPEGIADPEHPEDLSHSSGHICFREVTFAYKDGHPVLRNVSIDIPAGSTTALVGPSGAGKSTFVNLVPRFYECSQGTILLDGKDIRSFRLKDLRRHIALVSQEPVLFNDSIYNNILIGNPDADREAVYEAARNASAHEFILSLPNGYDTVIGERGASLSGGQRQRVAIARAFLRNAPILILDEVTAALDGKTEAAIQEVLDRLVKGKTVLIIAHRFSTIRNADQILLFDSGQLIAHGSHEKLYNEAPLYKALYDHQAINHPEDE